MHALGSSADSSGLKRSDPAIDAPTRHMRSQQILRDAESSLTVIQKVDAQYPTVTALSYCQIVTAIADALNVDRRDRLGLGAPPDQPAF